MIHEFVIRKSASTTIRRNRAKRRRSTIAAVTAVGLTGVLAACSSSGGSGGGFANAPKANAKSVSLLTQPWDDLKAENEIAKQLLEKLGYNVSVDGLAVDVGAKSIETGKIDGYLGNWWPSQKPTFGTMIDSGKVKVVGTVLTGTQYAPAIPGVFAKKYNINSLAQLAAHGAEFGRKIYGIEAGSPGNTTIETMIKNNDYGLGKWSLVPSSTPAMLTQVQRSITQKQPIVFLAWSPHWMTSQFDTVFLKDPKNVWGGGGEVRSVVNADFAKKSPNVTTLLGNMKFTVDQGGQFYLLHDKKGQDYPAIATAWIKANPDQVKKFLVGVKSADGKPAASVVLGS